MATTTSTSSSTLSSATSAALASSTAAVAAANKAAAQKLVTSLGAGSGVDVSALAQNLVDAERVPKENAINAKITKNESRISGYAAMSFVLSGVQTALTALKDQNNFNSLGVANSNSAAFSVATSATGTAGSHEIEVLRVAKAQRSVSNGVESPTASLNGGLAMSLTLNVGSPSPVSSTVQLAEGKDTPQEIVNAINDAQTGVTAKLVNTGDGSANPYQIVLSGPMGAAGAFDITPNYLAGAGLPGLSFPNGNVANQAASDALVKVDGISYTRNNNTLSDVVPGLVLGLKTTTSSVATIDVTRDNSGVKEKLEALVTAYNDAQTIFKEISDPKSSLDTYGATLVGDSSVRSVKQQLREMIMGKSSTPGDTVGALWQMGISIDMQGTMSLDSTKLDTVLSENYADVVKTFTGNKNGLSVYSTADAGVAGDAVRKISKLLGPTGIMQMQSASATSQNSKHQQDLAKLQTRMDSLLIRYQKQFSSMDSLVGNVNAQKTSLKSTFEGMMASLTGKSG